jgi:Holliday junction resolvasome RuvABC endonuclease subunit
MGILLALDQSSTATGYCVMRNGKISEVGCINVRASLDLFERTVEMSKDIRELLNKFKPDYLCLEEIYGLPGRYTALKALAIVRGALILVWYEYKHEAPIVINCSSARCKIGIKGNAKKPEVMAAVNAKFNLKIENEHEADAVVLGVVGNDMLPAKEPEIEVTNTAVKVRSKGTKVGKLSKGGKKGKK